MKKYLTRRLFFRQCIPAGVMLSGILTIAAGCSSKENKSGTEPEVKNTEDKDPRQGDANPNGDPCTDYSGLSQEDLKARSAMGYTPDSPMEEKQCANCQLFLPPPEGTACGRCQLFKGPVTAKGFCTYWAPQV